MRLSQFCRALAPLAIAGSCAIAAIIAGTAARAADVVVPGSTDFPESMSASSDGTLYFSSFGNGRVWRAKPGETQASEFIKSGSNGLASALGVLADDKSNTLYVCSNDFSAAGIKIPGGTAGRRSSCSTSRPARPRAASPLPGQPTLCNDIVVASDGTAYITDSFSGQILRLKPGAKELEVWTQDPRWKVRRQGATGWHRHSSRRRDLHAISSKATASIAFAVNADGSAGKITKLQTSRPLYHSDGLQGVWRQQAD